AVADGPDPAAGDFAGRQLFDCTDIALCHRDSLRKARSLAERPSRRTMRAMVSEWTMFGRVAVAFVLGFAIGWGREMRGAAAGDRTFALVTTASAAAVAVFARTSPNTVAGVLTGVGFIGGGLVMRSEHGMIKGITTAATIFTAAAIGVVAGGGYLMLAGL